jgi:hypothetical protein
VYGLLGITRWMPEQSFVVRACIREKTTGDGTYQFIGESYIHGVMFVEALKAVGLERDSLREFTLS